jgi:hypothetical protein
MRAGRSSPGLDGDARPGETLAVRPRPIALVVPLLAAFASGSARAEEPPGAVVAGVF